MLASAQWRTVSWRAVRRVGSKPGLPPSVWRTADRSSPADIGEGAAASSRGRGWLIGEHRASGKKKKYDLANLAAGTDLRS